MKPMHLYCLHYVFVPRISRHLTMWKDAWNVHQLRTENNKTPMQLWTAGLLTYTGRSLGRSLSEDELVLDEVSS